MSIMTDKRIKNEQWTVKDLISKINNDEISKPKYQRKQKWDIHPKLNKNNPNDYAFIKFLYDTENSVHAITFGQETKSNKIYYSNIDGNNRLNAIKHFMDKPFEIFNTNLDNLFELIDDLNQSEQDNESLLITLDDKNLLKKNFREISYHEIMNFKYNKFINDNNLYKKMRIYRDNFEPEIENIQKKLKNNNFDNFDTFVKINVTIFEGYNTDELCKTFEDINRYNGNLTETELLSCRLFNENNFEIIDPIFKTELDQCIKEYYIDKCKEEALKCDTYEPSRDKINANDFIVAFQNLCSKKYNFIDKIETKVDGLSLFFKIFKLLYNSYINTFTSDNINSFKEKIFDSCEILNKIILSIFTDKIILFNNSCQTKLKSLTKNNIFILLTCIIGYRNKQTEIHIINKSLEKCLLYHCMINDLKNNKEEFEISNIFTYKHGGGVAENIAKKLLFDPENISNKLSEEIFNNLITQLFTEFNSPYPRKLGNGKNSHDKRRPLKLFDKIIMFYYYKEKIPVNMLDNQFSIEHIFPNSSDWNDELDKDRPGNLLPIISEMNTSRSNKHIKEYKNNDFCKFITNIIPDDEIYDKIILHNKNKRPTIINNELYNQFCHKNEEEYKQNFLNCLFR
jgi:hypothetical protein